MTTNALELNSIVKNFAGRKALDKLTFSAPKGAITGLIGPNGAGKTTCFSVVGGLIRPDSGSINLLGNGPYIASQRRGELGLLPQDADLPGHARVDDVLCYLARLQGYNGNEARRQGERVLNMVSLSDRATSRISDLSHGMRRRISVAQALIGDPALVMLDEPMSGLDPTLVASMRDLLLDIRAQGRSLIVSSHVLSDLEVICDHVVFMEAGRCLRSASLSEVTNRETILNLELVRAPNLEAISKRLPGVRAELQGERLTVYGASQTSAAELSDLVLPALLELGTSVVGMSTGRSLESAYLSSRES